MKIKENFERRKTAQDFKVVDFQKNNEEISKNNDNYSILKSFTKEQELVRRSVLERKESFGNNIAYTDEITTNNQHNENSEAAHTESELKNKEKVYKWDIVWINVILIGSLHILAVYGFYLRLTSSNQSTITAAVVKVLAILSSIGITGGAHRLWTHRCYKANKKLECLLMFMATMTYQNSIYIWARDHRLHHKCSETDGDPHNAKRGFFFSHVGWLLVRKHPEVIKQGKTIDMSDLQSNPIVMFQHKYYFPLVLLCTFIIPGATAILGGFEYHEALFTCIIYKYVVSVNLTWCINSVAHIFGQRPYDKNIGPTESQMMRYLGFGEGFHNYHHTFPWDYKAAEFNQDSRNVTTYFIEFFAWLGWATDLREASEELIESRCNRTGGPGREYHMMKGNPDKLAHNMVSILVLALYVYIL